MGGTGRVLLVLRHSKAVHEPGLRDEDRGLTKRGLRDATAAGGTIRETGLIPDRVLCSAALRTRQTWQQRQRRPGPGGGQGQGQLRVEPVLRRRR